MPRRGSYIAVGLGVGLLTLAAVFLYKQHPLSLPLQSSSNSSDSGQRIPEPNCTYFSVAGAEFPAKVIVVRDADDLLVICRDTAGVDHEVVDRLAEIDSPEWGQPYHETAKALLSETTLGKTVSIRYKAMNDFRPRGGICRIVAWVRLPDQSDVSRILLSRDYAWHYEQYSDHKLELQAIENKARAEKLGLWADDNPVSPWDYRNGIRR